MKTSEVLYKAVDVINERGWHQGSLTNNEGAVCAVGAVNAATSGLARRFPLLAAPHIALEEHVRQSTPFVIVADFNDDPNTTKEDVLLALKTAAYEEELKEQRQELGLEDE